MYSFRGLGFSFFSTYCTVGVSEYHFSPERMGHGFRCIHDRIRGMLFPKLWGFMTESENQTISVQFCGIHRYA